MRVGFIGLGQMGLPMALNLCKAGYDVFVHSSNMASSVRIQNAGGNTISSFEEMAATMDVVLSILPADSEILDLYLGKYHLLQSAHKGLTCIDLTSAKGSTKQEIAHEACRLNKNLSFLDAPVSGGVKGAEDGTLTIMVGCEEVQFQQYQPIFNAIGQKIIYCGGVGKASDIKMLNQMLNAANTVIASEVICMAEQLGIDLHILCDVVNESSGGSYIFKNNVPKYILSGDHRPGFRLDLMKKDIRLCMESADQKEAYLPVAHLVYEIYKAVSNRGGGEMNYTYVAEWLKEMQKK